MARTNSTNVIAVLLSGKQYDGVNSPSLDAFIDTANSLVTQLNSECNSGGELDTARLELIERYLAAHFYAHADQQMQAKQTGDASATFKGKTDLGLNGTDYGQTALLLDTTGCLANWNQQLKSGKKKIGVKWLGKVKTEQDEELYEE